MVNFSYSNLAIRNEEVSKMKRENLNVARDIRLTGLAKMFVSDFLDIYITKDGSGIVRVNQLNRSELYDVHRNEKNDFNCKIKQEFSLIGYDGRIIKPEGDDDYIEVKIK